MLREALDWEAGLQVHARIALRFSRSESRQRVLAYLQGLLGSVERKNGWQLAEYAGDTTPDGVQRLLAVYHWDADQVRDDLQGYVVEHLGDPGGVLVVDETGFLKQGKKSVGVKRQYSGTAGKVENCQIGVFLAYGSRYGAAFLDRELYLPQEWAADRARRREAGVPEGVVFRTKAQLAQGMIERAIGSGVPFGWVTGDTVYGNDRKLRGWLEGQGRCYVLAVKNNEPLWADRERGSAPVAARDLAHEKSGFPSMGAQWVVVTTERLLIPRPALGGPRTRSIPFSEIYRADTAQRSIGVGAYGWSGVDRWNDASKTPSSRYLELDLVNGDVVRIKADRPQVLHQRLNDAFAEWAQRQTA